MSNNDRETLSALLDSEADELELRRILKSSEQDPELLAAWDRMNLVQALLHDNNLVSNGHLPLSGASLRTKVAAAIAVEPQPESTYSNPLNWGQSLAKVGIAASVALAFFLGMQLTTEQPNLSNQGGSPLAQQAAQPAIELSEVVLVDARPREVNPAARQRLEDYIQSVSITREEPVQLQQLQDSPLYRLVNDIQKAQ